MKKHLYLILLLIIAIANGCSKSGDNNNTNDIYGITGVSDIEVRQYTDTSITVLYHVAVPVGHPGRVTFKIEGLPPGVTVLPYTASDTTSFSVACTYHILMNTAASFPVTLTLSSAAGGNKSYKFDIIVTGATPFSYTVSGLEDIHVPLYSDTIVPVPVTATYTAGINEPVTIAVTNLPANITVTPALVKGLPPFSDTFMVHITGNAPGTFPVNVRATSSQGTKLLTFNAHVEANTDCASPLSGNYTANTVCASYSGAGTGISAGIVTAEGANDLRIFLPYTHLSASLDCGNATMNINPTAAGNINVAGGTGTFDATTITVNYTLNGAINSTCQTVLTR